MKYRAALSRFSIDDGVYVIGILERGVTIYNQQLRAHNLVWAIHNDCKHSGDSPLSFAVIGGGIAGLTTAACVAAKFPDAQITIFEKRYDLCPLQQGADHRYVQPKIYNWPDVESMQRSSDLPILRWSEGRASDITRDILTEFKKTADAGKICVRLGVEHIQVGVSERSIDFVGHETSLEGGFYRISKGSGRSEKFDKIILTSGFGLETSPPGRPSISYWRNEHRSQPVLNGVRESILISGYGDGALTDLCRATIERFRQDSIILEMFPEDQLPSHLVNLKKLSSKNLFHRLNETCEMHKDAEKAVAQRLRKDTKVYLHLGGADGANTKLSNAFGETSSFFNRYMLYLLYRCGAFTPVFGDLESAIALNKIPAEGVVCRHGSETFEGLKAIVSYDDWDATEARLLSMKKNQKQTPEHWFEPGFFYKAIMTKTSKTSSDRREPVPEVSQLLASSFLGGLSGALKADGEANFKCTLHRIMSRAGHAYLQQVCGYFPSSRFKESDVGRIFDVDTGIMGKAFQTTQTWRTKHFPNSSKYEENLAAAMKRASDPSLIEDVGRSWLAVPLLNTHGDPVLIFYAESKAVNYFASDYVVDAILRACGGFTATLNILAKSDIGVAKNYPLNRGELALGKGGAYDVHESYTGGPVPNALDFESYNFGG